MKKVKDILDFLLYSNLFVAACAFFYVLSQMKIVGVDEEKIYPYALLVFCSVFFIYGAQRMFGVITKKVPGFSRRERWYIKHDLLMYSLLSLAAAGIVLLTFMISWKLILYFLPLLLISVFYFAGPAPLKKMLGLKSFIIAFVWVMVCVEIPFLFYRDAHYEWKDFAYDAGQFLFIAALCIPFDIRDYRWDKMNKVNSLPVLIGVKNSAYAALLMMVLFPVLSMLSGLPEFLIYGMSVLSLCGIVVIIFTSLNRRDYYYGFLVESIVALPYPVLLICEAIFRR